MKEKEVNIFQRTVELLNLSRILNERDLFNTPLDQLQHIITARGEKKPHLEERNAQILKLIKHVKYNEDKKLRTEKNKEKENQQKKEIEKSQRTLEEMIKYQTKLQVMVHDKDIPNWNGKDTSLKKFMEEFTKFLKQKGLATGHWYPIFHKAMSTHKLVQIKSLMKPNLFQTPKIDISNAWNMRAVMKELQSSNYRNVIEQKIFYSFSDTDTMV
jgi:hypothetical protein